MFSFSPVLAELGALVPGRGFYFVTSEMDRLEERVRHAVDEYTANLARLARVGSFLPAARDDATGDAGLGLAGGAK